MDAPTEDSVSAAIDVFGLPVVLKTRKLAYDGRGNYVIESRDQIHTAFQALGGSELYVEKFVRHQDPCMTIPQIYLQATDYR